MAQAKQKRLYPAPADIEDDFETWSYQQAELLRQRRFTEIDLPNIVEELQSMGSEQRLALMSSYRLLVSHLLKWQFQPERRSTSWQVTIIRERDHIEEREKINHALRNDAKRLVDEVYYKDVREAATETGLAKSAFPADCPYTLEQLRDPDWMPK
jgi:hypothetical protein